MTESALPPTSEASLQRGANRVLFGCIAVLSLAGMIVSAVSLQRHYAKSATAYCDFQPAVQLRHREPQRVLDHPGNSSGGDWCCRVRCPVFPGDLLEVAGGNAKPPAGSGSRRTGVRPLPYLYRSVRTHDLVHFVPGVAGNDFSDQSSRDRSETERRQSVRRACGCI